jgi:type IV pilus assembly protein PilA
VIRSQISEGSVLADGVKTAVAEFYNNQGHYPATNASVGLASAESIRGQYVSSVDVGSADGAIVVTYSSSRPQKANTAIHAKTLLFVPQAFPDRIEWHCTSPNLKQKWCSSSCECRG